MKKFSFFSLFSILIIFWSGLNAQETRRICGQVRDESGRPLPMAYVSLEQPVKTAVTDEGGNFCIAGLRPGVYHLHISFLGYNCIHDCVADLSSGDAWLDLSMQPEAKNLSGVEVSAENQRKPQALSGVSTEVARKADLLTHQRSNLIKSLEYMPGLRAMEIGQGLAKPVIRGLGFDRVVVAEQGVKQEGQQWGADHGLEIDAFGVEELEVVKGPLSLLVGSDAVGGALMLKAPTVPAEGTFSGEATLTGHSVNDYAAASIGLKGNHRGWFSHLRTSLISYADYRVPADSFFYNNFRLPIFNHRLKNTAGNERSIQLGTGFVNSKSLTRVLYSDYYSRAGFFPGAHGIPTLNKILPGGSSRNIELPYQEVFHRKTLINQVFYGITQKWSLTGGYQDNLRREWSKFHTHYPNQPPPDTNPDLELQLRLKTLSLGVETEPMDGLGWLAGFQVQHQWNQTAGYMFLLAPYRRTQAGTFVVYRGESSPQFRYSAGLRYDYGFMHIDSVYSEYAGKVKSHNLRKTFHSLTFSLGGEWQVNPHVRWVVNLGKGFRLPSAMELSANGIHHGSFRYELGNPNLKPENMYQLDGGFYYETHDISLQFTPFIAYAPDFIFLTPTGSYQLPDGTPVAEADAGQVFIYRQAHALRTGAEMKLTGRWGPGFFTTLAGDYVYATDFDYPLPFTPPAGAHLELGQSFNQGSWKISWGSTLHAISAQNRVARNELPTRGYITQDIIFALQKHRYRFMLQWLNIWNQRYFNHIAFYRIIELPEAGSNLQLTLHISF
ncbi:MAG: TonB-dependent receptor [Bacteroidales bacterium]